MKVAYLVFFRGGRETGIHRKVMEHADEWRRRGVTVGLFVGTTEEARADWEGPATVEVVAMPPHAITTIRARETLASAVRCWSPDVLYARHGLAFPGFLLTESKIPTVIEINADDVSEFGATSKIRERFTRITRGMVLRRAAGLAFVTTELSVSPRFRRGPANRVVIGNGIRLADFPPFEVPMNDRPRLVFLGHPHSPWHGLDHALEMADQFPGWVIDIVGPGEDEIPRPPSNVRVHGTMTSSRYESILRKADVAIGSLGLYRNRMREACPLKLREYLARGIPAIIGHDDTDFPDPVPFIHHVPNEPTGVRSSLAGIDAFVMGAIGTRVPERAIAHLDVGEKEASRLRLLESVAKR